MSSIERRSLLLTDVVDSTRLADALGDEVMARVWAAHDRVARDLLAANGGREIDKTDGFLLLFDAPLAALRYATAYHRALAALDPPLQARAGLHHGRVVLTENAPADVARGAKPLEVDGVAKPVAARVMSVARGGQTLITRDAREGLPDLGQRIVSHGHWRMKGVDEPIELFEVAEAGVDAAPPPDGAKVYRVVRDGDSWLPVRAIDHSLPARRDAFVGRSRSLRALSERIDDGARLVSVLGIGGTGKTRVVSQYGWTWLGDWPGGVWFCDLVDARDVDGIVAAVARGLGVVLSGDDPVVRLGHAIAGRGRCLVILDNFEQVARHAQATLGRWLDRAPEAAFVVTSREVLGLPGEAVFALQPLDEPSGVALFRARASQARRDFQADVADVAELVRLLDGLPLAIELAAARVRVMPVRTVLQRLGERFRLLAGTGRADRHATLRAVLDGSWELLGPEERAGLAQLSVFEGGFDLEAAEEVLDVGDAWAADVVQALVDRSLVRGGDRLDLLVTVREYAAERLAELGGTDAAERRHGSCYARRRRLQPADVDNVVAACRRATARREATMAVDTLRGAWAVLKDRGPLGLAVRLAQAVDGLPGLSGRERCRVDEVLGVALLETGRTADAEACLRAGVERAAVLPLPGAELSLHLQLATLCRQAGRSDGARGHVDAAFALGEAIDDPPMANLWKGRAMLAAETGDTATARELFGQALAIHEASGDEAAIMGASMDLGTLLARLGDHDAARRLDERALSTARALGQQRTEAHLLGNLALLDRDAGRHDDALAHFDGALRLHRLTGERRAEGLVLGNRATVSLALGRLEEARTGLEAALAIHREVGAIGLEGAALSNLGAVLRDLGRLAEARASYEEALDLHVRSGNRTSEGIARGNLGSLDFSEGQVDRARAQLTRALELHRDVGFRYGQGYWLGGLAQVASATGEDWRARADEAVEVSRPFRTVHADARVIRAELRLDAGETAAALDDAQQATACADGGALLARAALVEARALFSLGDADGAANAVDRAAAAAAVAGLPPTSPVVGRIAAQRRG